MIFPRTIKLIAKEEMPCNKSRRELGDRVAI